MKIGLLMIPKNANQLIESFIEKSEERIRKKNEKETLRKSAIKKLRLPGKLSDCLQNTKQGSELFIVEGDSAEVVQNKLETEIFKLSYL